MILAGRRREAEPLGSTILFVPVTVPLPQVAAGYGPKTGTRSSYAIVRFVSGTRSSVTGAGASKRTTSITTGLESVVADALAVARPSPFCRCFPLPYTHYSLLARCQVWWRRAVEHCWWEEAAPKCKAPDRLPDASTIRRWSSGVDDSPSAPPFLRQMMARVAQRLAFTDLRQDEAAFLSWLTPILELLRPLRL